METKFYQALALLNAGQTQQQVAVELNIGVSTLQQWFQDEAFQQEQIKQQKCLILASIDDLVTKMPDLTSELVNIILGQGYSIREKIAAYNAILNGDFNLPQIELDYLLVELKAQIQEQAVFN
ncbi:MAG: hypothetical protein WA865_01860 [Spirulinaceae cyanobacterium]